MTEADWLAASDPQPMLAFLHTRGGTSERKLRLFAVACCRRVLHELRDERSREALVVAERYADGLATEGELDDAATAACEVCEEEAGWASPDAGEPEDTGRPLTYSASAYTAAIPVGWWGAAPAFVEPYYIILDRTPDKESERVTQAALLRCIVGNPVRPAPSLASAVLAFDGGTVPRLAAAIYEDRAFGRLPVLADALEDAGCAEPGILGHCRAGGEHVRGCWVVDLVLSKS
jgi:hypothetical protein